MKLNKRESILLVVLLVILIGFGFHQVYLKGALETIDNLDSETSEAVVVLNDSKAKAAMLPSIDEQIQDIQNELEVFNNKIPHAVDEPQLMLFLADTVSDLAGQYQITSESETVSLEYAVVKVFQVNFTTDSDGYPKVLNRFYNAPYKNRINTATLHVNDSPTDYEHPIEVSLFVEFLCYDGDIDLDKSYSFSDGEYGKTDLYPSITPTTEPAATPDPGGNNNPAGPTPAPSGGWSSDPSTSPSQSYAPLPSDSK